jgi:hypothetical protein
MATIIYTVIFPKAIVFAKNTTKLSLADLSKETWQSTLDLKTC